ncbi:glycosyltransferase [Methylotenera sp.]|uniref:glycosyltransferase n=1 Tax=Methylotenera sp. TaxID=2051956 RepID=UPI0027308876|nr:glycosyltransferase [Methylotenera sp.]MDP2231497.1 glycosyltransferase [Methylotenera sp.]
MHIAIVGPIATADIAHLLNVSATSLPIGRAGAPLLVTLISELLRLGHQVSAFTLSNDIPLNQQEPTIVKAGNFMLSYSPMRPHAWRFNGLRLGRILDLYTFERGHLQRAIAQASPDVVHAHWTYEYALAALKTGLPHVVTCHDSPYKVAKFYGKGRPTRSLYRWLRVLMARKVLREASCVTAVSSYMKDEVQNMASVPVSVIPNPVDDFSISIGWVRKAPSSMSLAMVCNGWQKLKNPQPAMKAFAKFKKGHPVAKLHLYGHDFGVGQTAEAWAKQQNIAAGMTFHGAMPHKQLLQELSTADLLLHSSLEESFGLSIAEAMGMGLPIVAGESSGAVPWVVGGSGVLCDVRQENAIKEAIEHVLIPTNYTRYSLVARGRVQAMFTASAVTDAYLEAYKTAINKKPSSH